MNLPETQALLRLVNRQTKDTASFLKKMKELAVVVVHKSIHLRNLWKMQQNADEPIRAFAARLTATADMCGMVVECTNQVCKRQSFLALKHVSLYLGGLSQMVGG